jgi:hypothetical protein
LKEIQVQGWVGTISQVRKSINGLIEEKNWKSICFKNKELNDQWPK